MTQLQVNSGSLNSSSQPQEDPITKLKNLEAHFQGEGQDDAANVVAAILAGCGNDPTKIQSVAQGIFDEKYFWAKYPTINSGAKSQLQADTGAIIPDRPPEPLRSVTLQELQDEFNNLEDGVYGWNRGDVAGQKLGLNSGENNFFAEVKAIVEGTSVSDPNGLQDMQNNLVAFLDVQQGSNLYTNYQGLTFLDAQDIVFTCGLDEGDTDGTYYGQPGAPHKGVTPIDLNTITPHGTSTVPLTSTPATADTTAAILAQLSLGENKEFRYANDGSNGPNDAFNLIEQIKLAILNAPASEDPITALETQIQAMITADVPYSDDNEGQPFNNVPQGVDDELLPQTDSSGNAITYREADLRTPLAASFGAARLAVGSDGSIWMSTDHYHTFVELGAALQDPTTGEAWAPTIPTRSFK